MKITRKQRALLDAIRKAEKLADELGHSDEAKRLYGIGCGLGSSMVASR